MILEDYVSFETAKLLKEKGFPQEYDEYHSLVYNEKDYEDEYEVQRMVIETRTVKAGTLSSYPIGVPEPKCYCPTLQMAMKWLREIHHYYIQVMLDSWAYGGHMGYYVVIQKTDSDFEMMLQDAVDEVFYQTYEEACEAAIKYCLENLI